MALIFRARWWLSLMLLVHSSHGVYNNIERFFNRDSDCGSNPIIVTKADVYKIEMSAALANGNSSFRECQMIFTSDGSDGPHRLCLVQDTPYIRLMTDHVKLAAVEVGHGGETGIFTVGKFPSDWNDSEYCTRHNSEYISIKLLLKDFFDSDEERAATAQAVDIGKIRVHLKVLDMGSRNRRVDLDYRFCERTFKLDHSEISVYNRRWPADLRVPPFDLKTKCQVTFEKESSGNRHICVVYISQGSRDCSSNHAVYVLRERSSLEASNVVYKHDCEHNREKISPFALCLSDDIDRVTLLHWRQVHVQSNQISVERPEMYRMIVADFPGDNTTELTNYTLSWVAKETETYNPNEKTDQDHEIIPSKDENNDGDNDKNEDVRIKCGASSSSLSLWVIIFIPVLVSNVVSRDI